MEIIAEKEKTNIEKLKGYISEIDSHSFPQKPLSIEVDEKNTIKEEAAHIYEKDEAGNIVKHYYMINKDLDNKQDSDYSLFGIAIHEVRHRAQLEILDQKDLFKKANLKLLDKIDYKPLKELREKNNKEISEQVIDIIKKIENKKGKKLSSNDYDAVVVEAISRLLYRHETPTYKTTKILIKKTPQEIVEGLNIISKKHKWLNL